MTAPPHGFDLYLLARFSSRASPREFDLSRRVKYRCEADNTMARINCGQARIHDWSRVDVNLYHDFHQSWTVAIASILNGGLLRTGYSALIERSGDRSADSNRHSLAEHLADR